MAGGDSVEHRLTVRHPAIPGQVPCGLVEKRGEQGVTTGYSMVVESVTCADKQCEVIPVGLFWNQLGTFDRYELRPGDELAKKDHEAFSREDYKTLDKILAKPDSPLKWVEADELVPPEQAMVGGVDVVSELRVGTSPVGRVELAVNVEPVGDPEDLRAVELEILVRLGEGVDVGLQFGWFRGWPPKANS